MSGQGQRKSSPWRVLASVAGVLVFCGLIYVVVSLVLSDKSAPRKPPEIKIVAIIPPPPPPPPPPPEPPKMVEQTPVPEEKPKEMMKEEMKKDDEPPPGPLSMDAKGEGPGDLFGLGGKPGGRGLLGGGGGRYVPYASMVQAQIAEVLRQHPKLKYAAYRIPIDVWPDSTGRISRAEIGSTGDREVDAAMRQALVGLRLREPPPKDMPMPINIRLTGKSAG